MWFNVLKTPVREGSDIPYGSDLRFSLASNMAFQNRHSAGIVWESKDEKARGYAFEYGDEWLITVFEILNTGKGQGEKYLKEFIKDLKVKHDYEVSVVTVLPESSSFWNSMVDKKILRSATKYHFPEE